MADLLRHRQTKEAETDMADLTPPRHIPTLPQLDDLVDPIRHLNLSCMASCHAAHNRALASA
jgi:hypothetical protein